MWMFHSQIFRNCQTFQGDVNLLVISQSLEVSFISRILCKSDSWHHYHFVSWQVVLNTCSAASCVCWWLWSETANAIHRHTIAKNLDEYQSGYKVFHDDSKWFMMIYILVDFSWYFTVAVQNTVKTNHLDISYLCCTVPIRTGKSWIVGGRRTVGDGQSFADLLSASFSPCAAAHEGAKSSWPSNNC